MVVRLIQRTAQVFFVALGIFIVPAAMHSAQDVLAQLGVKPKAASDAVMTGVTSGSVNTWAVAKSFKMADAAVRAELASGGIAWAKTYTQSPEFASAYAKLREERKPQAPVYTDTPEEALEQQLARQKDEAQKNAEDMKKALETMPPDVRKQVEEGMKGAAAALAQMDTPEMRKIQLDGMRMERESRKTQYADDLKQWEAEYPANPTPLISKRLKAFLDLSASVNFDAKVEPRDGKLRFVDPQYERKPADWKLLYRAGRPAVDAARASAQAWLAELK
jgi:hypothetical protein